LSLLCVFFLLGLPYTSYVRKYLICLFMMQCMFENAKFLSICVSFNYAIKHIRLLIDLSSPSFVPGSNRSTDKRFPFLQNRPECLWD
jgi:hypothetical protein